MKQKTIMPILCIGSLILLSSCVHNLPNYSPEEVNLQSLNRITDNEDNYFEKPFGGDQGRNLFFAVVDKRGNSNIYQKENPVSNAMSPKTSGRNNNTSPTYCAILNQVAYSGRQEGAFHSDIFMLNASQGSAIRRITNTPNEEENYPCLSADGRTIIYQKKFVGGSFKDAQIWRQDLRTESPTLLCQGQMPSFSHDSRLIVFVRYTADGDNSCLVMMNADGQNQTELTDAKMGLVQFPRFSPNDQQIVFQCRKKDKKDFDLYVINRDGTGLTQLTFNKSFDGEPYWASDGYIYFTSDRGGRKYNYQIWRFQYGGGSFSSPVSYGAEYTSPQPSYSNQVMYHNVAEGETITKIAQKYNVTVREIVKWNGLTTMTLKPGMMLKVSAQ
jgi:TolB protein